MGNAQSANSVGFDAQNYGITTNDVSSKDNIRGKEVAGSIFYKEFENSVGETRKFEMLTFPNGTSMFKQTKNEFSNQDITYGSYAKDYNTTYFYNEHYVNGVLDSVVQNLDGDEYDEYRAHYINGNLSTEEYDIDDDGKIDFITQYDEQGRKTTTDKRGIAEQFLGLFKGKIDLSHFSVPNQKEHIDDIIDSYKED